MHLWGYLALLTGNTLDVMPDETKMYCDKLKEFFLSRNIFCCEITPTRMNMQLEYYKKNELHSHWPQVVLSIGEALPLGIAKQFFSFAEIDKKLINFYGPTETCVYSSYYEINSKNIEVMDCMLIGKPILQTSLYVLNEQLKPCEIGEEGELYIGGVGLAIGYIGELELTEKMFVPNPFQIGTRLYKTNDLVRMKDSLDVEYIGRKDRQIKLHGFRIELSEIERNMERMEGITRVYVNLYSEAEEGYLAMFFTASCDISLDAMIEHLNRMLPHYMVPSYFVHLDAFEYTLNGKLDERRLPEPKANAMKLSRSENDGEKSPYQEEFYQICLEVLQEKDIIWEENFIFAGGDSLSAFQLSLEISQRWGVVFELEELFHSRSMKDLVYLLQKKIGEKKRSEVTFKEDKPLYANGFQETILKVEGDSLKRIRQNGIDSIPTYNMVYLVKTNRYIEKEKLCQALEQVIKKQEMLRSYFIKEKSKHQIICEEGCSGYFEEVRIDGDLDKIPYRNYVEVFKADTVPLFKIILFENSMGEQCLLLNFYHLIFDVLSLRIFIEQLFRLYSGDSLVSSGVSMREYLLNSLGADLKWEYQFWKEYLKDRPVATVFSPDRGDRQLEVKKEDIFRKLHFKIEKETTEKVRILCRGIGITEYIFYVSIYVCTLYSMQEEENVIIGTYVMGRDQLALESELIGLFTKFIPFRICVKPDSSFEEFFRMLREQFLILNSHIGFEMNNLFKCMYFDDLLKGALFWTSFNIQTGYSTYIKRDGRSINTTDISVNPEVLPISMIGNIYKEEIRFEILYIERLYTEAGIQAIVDNYNQLIQIVSCDSSAKIKEIIKKLKKLSARRSEQFHPPNDVPLP